MILSSFFSGSTVLLISIKETRTGPTIASFALFPCKNWVVEQTPPRKEKTLLTFCHTSKRSSSPGRTQKFPRDRILSVCSFSTETRTLVNYSSTFFFPKHCMECVLSRCLWSNGLNSPVPKRNFQLLLLNLKHLRVSTYKWVKALTRSFLICWVSLKLQTASCYSTPSASVTTKLSARTPLLYRWSKLCHTSTVNPPLVREI